MKRLAMLFLIASPLTAQVRPIPVPDSLAPGVIGHRGHVSGPMLVAASADGGQLISAETPGRVIVWDGVAEKPRRILDFDAVITALSVSPDGRRYAVGGWRARGEGASFKLERTVRIFDIDGLQPALTFNASVSELRFSPDGRTLVGALSASAVLNDTGGLVAWDLVSGVESRRVLADAKGFASIAGFTRDGREILALTCCASSEVLAYPATLKGDTRMVLSLPDAAIGDVSPTSDVMAITTGNAISLVSTASGAVIGTLPGGTKPVRRLTFSTDGRHLASYVPDGPTEFGKNELVIWDVASLRLLHAVPLPSASSLRAAPTGFWIGSRDGTLWLVDVPQGTVVRTVAPESAAEERKLFYSRPDGSGEFTTWRLLSIGPVVRDTSPPEHFPPVQGASGREYWTIDLVVENDGRTTAQLWSPSTVTNVDGRPNNGSILLMRRKGNEGYPLVYLNPKGGGAVSLSMSPASRGKGQSLGVQIQLQPHQQVRTSLVFVVPKKLKEEDVGLFFLEGSLITLRAAATP